MRNRDTIAIAIITILKRLNNNIFDEVVGVRIFNLKSYEVKDIWVEDFEQYEIKLDTLSKLMFNVGKIQKSNGKMEVLKDVEIVIGINVYKQLVVVNSLGLVNIASRKKRADIDYIEYNTINVISGTDEESIKHKKEIDKRYERFVSKSRMIGAQNEFDYAVDKSNVYYVRYKGNSNKVFIPSFITHIINGAFTRYTRIDIIDNINELELSEGLKVIEDYAFSDLNLTKIKIPNSVKMVGHGAFMEAKFASLDIVDGSPKGIILDSKYIEYNKNTIFADRIV